MKKQAILLSLLMLLFLCSCSKETATQKNESTSAETSTEEHIKPEDRACNHTWVAATCTAPSTCSICSETTGEAVGHTWTNATCTAPASCTVCGATGSNTAEHKYDKTGNCADCGTKNPKISELEEALKIYGTWIKVNSADGVSMYITWDNNSEKEIKYITFKVQLYNRVNDPVDCTIRKQSIEYLQQTGPIPQGKGNYIAFFRDVVFKGIEVSVAEESKDLDNGWSGVRWENIWYNSDAYYAKVIGVNVEYMDGTTYSCNGEDLFDSLGITNLNVKDDYTKYIG